jgi:Flp pilus assembly pilin Flp
MFVNEVWIAKKSRPMITQTMITQTLRRFLSDQEGAEVTELGIVLGLIVAGSVIVIISLGVKVSDNYVTFNGQLP